MEPNINKTLFSLCLVLSVCHSLKLLSLQKTYEKGVRAYSNEKWSECIYQFEESLHLYKLYKSVTVNCRMKCNSQSDVSVIKENIGDLKLYETFFLRKDCLIRCLNREFENLHLQKALDDSVLHNMQERKPYEYLHICYFQMFALQKAASAAHTHLIAHPDDKTMAANLKYYLEQPEVDINEVVDLESDDYVVLFKLGLKAYSKNNWAETVANMEEVLNDYFSTEYICRVECEHQPEQEWASEFFVGMSNNIAALLHCQQQCQDKLKPLHYDSGVEFIADVLNYIQISYYKLDRLNDAAKAVASYLALLPYDEDMLANRQIYSSLTDETAFTERSEIIYYYKRDAYEKNLINLFHQGNNDSIDSNSI